MLQLFAQMQQMRPVSTWGFGELLIAAIIVAGCIAVAFVLIRVFGIQIPAWVFHIFWIVVAVFIGIFAIRLMLGM